MKPFLEEVAEDLVYKLGDGLSNSALIFVNKRPLIFIQKYLSNLKEVPVWAPYLFTIQEFIDQSSRLKIGDSYTQFFCLWEAYKELLTNSEMETLRIDQFYRIGLSLISDFNQIDEEMIEVNTLYQDLRDRAEIDKAFGGLDEDQINFLKNFWSSFSRDKRSQVQDQFIKMWNRMPKLYKRFHENLESRGLTTQGMQYRRLGEGMEEIPQFMDQFQDGKLVFIGFNALSKAEAKIFKKWQNEKKALFYFDFDSYYINDDLQEAGKFLRKNLKLGLLNSLDCSSRMDQDTKPVHVYSIQGTIAQAKILPQIIKIQEKDLQDLNNPTQSAVILADESLLIPVLQSLPLNFPDSGKKIPLNITMGYSMKTSPLFSLIELWIFFQKEISQSKKEEILYNDVEAFLSHPFIEENSNTIKKFRDFILVNRLTEISLKDIVIQDSSFPIFFRIHQEGIESLNSFLQYLEFIRNREGMALHGLDYELILSTIQELRLLIDSLLEFKEKISLSLVFSFLKKILKTITVPLAGEPLEGLQIMGLMETRSLDFNRIYILGAGDSFLPKPSNRESLIPDSIRKAYGLSIAEDQDALIAYVFYRLFQRSQEVHILYNSVQDENNSGEPSRFIRQIEFESQFSFKKYVYIPQFGFNSPKSIIIEKKGFIRDQLKKYYTDGDSSTCFSASAYILFLECPLRFYFKYLAKIGELETVPLDIEPRFIGEVFHATMEAFYQVLIKDGNRIEKESIEKNKNQIPDIIKNCYINLSKKNEGIKTQLTGKDQIAIEVIQEYVRRVYEHDLSLAPFQIFYLEDHETFVLDFPIQIENNTRKIQFKGIIDRIDDIQGTRRIVDYKTGNASLDYSHLEDMFERDSKKINTALIQTLIYTMIAQKFLDIKNLEPHLYLVNDLKSETRFFRKADKSRDQEQSLLYGEFLNEEIQKFKELLKKSLEDLFDIEKPFYQTNNRENCENCPYKIICSR